MPAPSRTLIAVTVVLVALAVLLTSRPGSAILLSTAVVVVAGVIYGLSRLAARRQP